MTPDHHRPDRVWTIILPVKDTRVAKTRLRGLSQPVRSTLALAFALDAVTASVACDVVREVLIVTNDRLAARRLAGVGGTIVPDLPDAGLNPALEHGEATARRRSPDGGVAALFGDLPALRSDDVAAAVTAGSALPRWFVPDAEGLGTTMLAAGPGQPLSPTFGVGSRALHRRSGAQELATAGLERLRRDVDTEEQLWEAVRLGVGWHTRQALADLELVAGRIA